MPNEQEAEEKKLLAQAQQGSVEAFGDLYERLAPAVFRYLNAHLQSWQDAEDLTADVFFKAWQAIPQYHERGVPFLAYLLRIARNTLVDHYRRTRWFRFSDAVDGDQEIPQLGKGPAELTQKKHEYEELHRTLDRLQQNYRLVLLLRFVEGYSVDKTSLIMRKSPGAVRVLTHRALVALRRQIDQQGKQDG